MGKLIVEVDFPTGTSRERLMELLSDVLYKPDVNVFDPMPIEEHDWDKIFKHIESGERTDSQ